MSEVTSIDDLLSRVGPLREILDDLNVKYVTIAANGFWSFEKLGRMRTGNKPIPGAIVRGIGELVPADRHLRHGDWALRRYDGVGGPSILIERLPVAIADRLPQEILAVLKKQMRQNGNGGVIGQPGCGKAALLLWLALQIPDEPVLYVSENPPAEFPGNHIVHVYPPTTPGERRSLERFVRLSATVMWDRIASPEDLLTLFGFPGAKRRWLTLDSSSIRSALRMLAGAVQYGCDARFSTLLSLSTSVIGRPEPRNLAVREQEGWTEPFCSGESALEYLAAFEDRDVRRLVTTELSVPDISLRPKVEVAEDFAAEAEEFQTPVMTELTEASEASEASETSEAEEASEAPEPGLHTIEVDVDADAVDGVDDAATGVLRKEDADAVPELLDGSEQETELHLPLRARLGGGLPEVTRQYDEKPPEIGIPETTASLIESRKSADETPARINVENLRITTDGALSGDYLEVAAASGDEDSYPEDDFSGVLAEDLDFEQLADDMLSEISEVESSEDSRPRGAVASTDPAQPIFLSEEDIEPIEEAHEDTVAARISVKDLARRMKQMGQNEEESTREFTLNEKLLTLRQSRESED